MELVATSLPPNVVRAVIPLKENSDWSFTLLTISDTHFDSTKCNRELLKTHLDMALENDWGIISCGDLFDVMQGKFDPRNSKYALRPEYRSECYIDDVVEDCSSFLKPYAKNILMLGDGNHETSIKKRLETDLTQRTLSLLNGTTGSRIAHGYYAGWLQLHFKREKSRVTYPVNINYHHGSGLKSKAAQARRMAQHPDAHILLTGHFHEFWSEMISRQRISTRGKLYKDLQIRLGIPGYKDDYGPGHSGWGIEKAHLPKHLGAWRLDFTWSRKHQRVVYEARALM